MRCQDTRGGSFCDRCGTPVKKNIVTERETQGKSQVLKGQGTGKKSLIIRVCAVVLFFAVGIITLFTIGIFGGKDETKEVWGLSFQGEEQQPIANSNPKELAKYNTFYVQDTQEKVLYLTFDCEYENGNTHLILEALKKHGAKATFFVVGDFITTNSHLVKRMVEEGHAVGNSGYHNSDMSEMSEQEFSAELEELETLYEKTIGTPMIQYYRPPQGKYSKNSLQIAKNLGYKTFLWSLAYVDWNQDSQPTHEEAFDKLMSRVHPGAIVLLHNTSQTNGEILDALLTRWEEMGYSFKSLSELADSL